MTARVDRRFSTWVNSTYGDRWASMEAIIKENQRLDARIEEAVERMIITNALKIENPHSEPTFVDPEWGPVTP